MAGSNSPSFPQEPTIAQQHTSGRRLPPPCWSHDDTVALIDAYRDKWYSVSRGYLRASHWQEVADGVAARCPSSNPPKTSIQCRHKMEKMRKRYRAEIQPIGNTPRGNRYTASWAHFKRMDSMEVGSSASDSSGDPNNADEDEEEDRLDDENHDELWLYPKGIKQAIAMPLSRRYQGSASNRIASTGAANGNGNGVRTRLPNIAAVPPSSSGINLYNNRSFDDDDYPPPMNPRYSSVGVSRDAFIIDNDRNENCGMKRREEMGNDDSNLLVGMVAAIHKVGDDFVKMERMKMDMARELQLTWMKMEMKRTEMVLESQQRLVDSFLKTVMEKKNKKIKRMPTPES